MPPQTAEPVPPVPTPVQQKNYKIPAIAGGVALVGLVGAWLFFGSSTQTVALTDVECEQIYWDSSLAKAQTDMEQLQATHPEVSILEASLNIFYSPTLGDCVISNFARIQGTFTLQPEQFPDMFFESAGETAVVAFLSDTVGRAITPSSLEWEGVMTDLSASEAQKSGSLATNPSNDEECQVAFSNNLSQAIDTLSEPGESVSKALFFSTSLGYCVGIVQINRGREQEFNIFNAATGYPLDADDNVTAIADYAARGEVSMPADTQ